MAPFERRRTLPDLVIPSLPSLLRLALAPLLLLWAALSHGAALPPIAMHHTAWTARDGVPPFVIALAQTEDGWLWLASSVGLYRFDGMRFERYMPPDGALPSINATALRAAPDNGLWVGYRFGGISLLRKGRTVRHYGTADGLPAVTVWDVLQDGTGTAWAATGMGLYRLHGERWEAPSEAWAAPKGNTTGMVADRLGTLWVQTTDATYKLPHGAQRFEKLPGDLGRGQPVMAPDGSVWAGDQKRMQVVMLKAPDGRRAIRHLPVAIANSFMGEIARDGSFWLSSREGIARMRADGTHTELSGRGQGLSGGVVITTMQDREGNMWISTTGGIDRFRPNKLSQATLPVYLGEARAIAPGADGAVHIDRYTLPAGATQAVGVPPGPALPEERNLTTLYRDPAGVLWGAGLHELWRMEGGKRVDVARPPGADGATVYAMTMDRSGALWVAFRKVGLQRLVDGAWELPALKFGVEPAGVVALHADGEGRIWFGHNNNRLSLLEDGKLRSWGAADGLQLGAVRQIVVNGRQVLAGGSGGIAALTAGRIVPILGAGGEDFVGTTGMQLLPDGQLWLNSGMGIFAIPAAELRRALADRTYRVAFERFDHQDGLRGGAPQVSAAPSLVRASDGKLWFTTTEGVFWIDPARIARNPLPPPVEVLSLDVNGRKWLPQDGLALPPRIDNLRIDYTALSLTMPDRARFRYRLLGIDEDWQPAGARRAAFYNHLPPGQYRFQLTAANSDGLWNEHGTELAFSVAPTLTQTAWFRALAAVLAALVLFLLYRLRLHRMAGRIRHRLEERLAERERIARELHDTLLQSVHGLILHFQAVAMRMPPQEPTRALMESALQRADEVLVEGRDRVRDLRSAAGDAPALAENLCALAESLAPDGSPAFHVEVEGTAQALHPLVAEEVFAIAREAMVNAVRHAGAREVNVTVSYDSSGFRLQVHDNGMGIERAVVDAGGRSGHWGLAGMQERADKIHAKLHLRTREGEGTEWLLTLPAALAYLPQPRRPRWRFWQGGDDNTEQAA